MKIRIVFCVFMNTGVGRVVCSSTPPHWGQTGEVGIPDRPTERPGYAQIARARPTTTQGPARGAQIAHYLGPNAPPAVFLTVSEFFR